MIEPNVILFWTNSKRHKSTNQREKSREIEFSDFGEITDFTRIPFYIHSTRLSELYVLFQVQSITIHDSQTWAWIRSS